MNNPQVLWLIGSIIGGSQGCLTNCIAALPQDLPQHPGLDPEVDHAPIRKQILSPTEERLALQNAFVILIQNTTSNYLKNFSMNYGHLDEFTCIVIDQKPIPTRVPYTTTLLSLFRLRASC